VRLCRPGRNSGNQSRGRGYQLLLGVGLAVRPTEFIGFRVRTLTIDTLKCGVVTEVQAEYDALSELTEREESIPKAVRHYMKELDELMELAKDRMDLLKVSLCRFIIGR
jgi:hypothetical protein